MVQKNDAALLSQLPSDWAQRDSRLRSFALNVAKRGERRWILAIAQADPELIEELQLLHAACSCGRVEAAAMLARIGADVHAENVEGLTSLHLAAKQDCSELVNILAGAEADINAKSSRQHCRPLTLAAACNGVETCRALLASRADIKLEGGSGSPLMVAVTEGAQDVLELLVAAGASATEVRHEDHASPLHEAARRGHKVIAARLLALGALVNARTHPNGNTPLHLACRAARTDVVALLLTARAEANSINEAGQTPMGLAFQASQRSREARSAFRELRQVLADAGAALGEYNPTLYEGAGRRSAPTAST
jgi:ankyrin repeat protein